jgi:hypothetical protein
MRYSFAASGLLGLAAAAPQRINIAAALAVPTPAILGPGVEETIPAPVSYNPTAAASAAAAVVKSEGAIQKRDQVYDINIGAYVDSLDGSVEFRNATVRRRNACDAQPLG